MIKFARHRLQTAPNIAPPVPESGPELVPSVRSTLLGGERFDMESDAVEIVATVGPEPPETPTALRVPAVRPGSQRARTRPQWNLVISPSSDLAPPPVPAPVTDLPPPREPAPEPSLAPASTRMIAANATPESKVIDPIARPSSVAPMIFDPNASLISASLVADVRGYAQRPRGLMAAALMGLALIVGVTGSQFFSARYVAHVAAAAPPGEAPPAEEVRFEVAPPPVAPAPAKKSAAAPLVFQDALSIEVPAGNGNANATAPARAPETAPSVIEAPPIHESVRPRHRR